MVPRQPAPRHAVPVYAGPAHTFARQERAELAHRKRGLIRVVPEGQRLARQILHQFMTLSVAQLVVNGRVHEIRIGIARRAAFQHDNREAGFGELLGENASGPAETDDDDVSGFEFRCHGGALSQLKSWMDFGATSYCLLRYFSMSSAYIPMAPGKPIIFHTALLRLPPYIGSAKYPSMAF